MSVYCPYPSILAQKKVRGEDTFYSEECLIRGKTNEKHVSLKKPGSIRSD